MLEIKKKSKYFALIGVLLLVAGTMSATLAWVSDSQKAKLNSDEILISKTDNLMISVDDNAFYSTIDLSDDLNYRNINLKDFSGDGIGLYSAVIDPYTKQAQANGWQFIKTDVSEEITQEKKNILDANNKNKTYYMFDVYFKSTVPLNVYLHQDSYVNPSTKEMNTLNDNKKYCLFIKRTAKYDEINDKTTYTYETENGVVGIDIASEQKEQFESTKLPTVYNRSIYSSNFDDDKDLVLFLDGTYTSVQTQYSANYIASSARVSLIDDDKIKAPATADQYDYKTIRNRVGEGGTLQDYVGSRLRMLWAPNPEVRLSKTYSQATDSTTYFMDVINLKETYYASDNSVIGESVTYNNGAKYYYKMDSETGSTTFLLYTLKDVLYDLDGAKITDKNSQAVVDYNQLLGNTVRTTTNQSERTGSRIIDGETVSDNRFYSYNGSAATLSSVPTQLFANDLDATSENLDNYSVISTLTKKLGTDYYEGKTTVVIWVEGSDPEASIALTAGNGAGLSEGSGIAKLAYCLSFIGKEIPNTPEA